MAAAPDIEAAKSSTKDNHGQATDTSQARVDACDSPETITERGHERLFDDQYLRCAKSLDTSRQRSEERLGVLLLLDYKAALDRLNRQYHEMFAHGPPRPGAGEEAVAERYVKTRDLYMSHLEHFPPTYGTKDAYEMFLIHAVASITTLRIRNLPFPKWEELLSCSSLKPALDLKAAGDREWYLGGLSKKEQDRPIEERLRGEFSILMAFAKRSAFALLGGFALIIPMLVMKLYPTTLTVCLTTTLFVIVAAFLLAVFMKDTEPKDILGITAAYAAVLVVFVGTSTTTSGADNRKVAIIMGSLLGGILVVVVLFGELLRRRRKHLIN